MPELLGLRRLQHLSTDLNSLPNVSERALCHALGVSNLHTGSLSTAIGLINFHARKDDSIKQEIFASLIMYNLCERIAAHAVISQSDKTKHVYQVNFTMAIYVCLQFYRNRSKAPPDILTEITRYIEPVRKGRTDKRKLKPKSVINFIYRVA